MTRLGKQFASGKLPEGAGATVVFLVPLKHGAAPGSYRYRTNRRTLGLELPVAGDVIGTVAVTPTDGANPNDSDD